MRHLSAGRRYYILSGAILSALILVLAGCPLPFEFTPSTGDLSAASSNDPANPSVTAAPSLLITEMDGGATVDASPGSITVGTDVQVGFSSQTPGAAVFYTTDGTRPVPGASTTKLFNGSNPVVLDSHLQSRDIRAIAIGPSMYPSTTTQRTVTVAYETVGEPVFSPDGGVFAGGPLSVTITSATQDATIWYTTDGTVPAVGGGGSTQSIASGGSVTLTTDTTIRAIAGASSTIPSAMVERSFIVTNFSDTTLADIVAVDNLLSSDDIDNKDGNRIPAGTIIYYVTGEGQYGKLLVKVSWGFDPNNHGMTIDYVTYATDGSVTASGTDTLIQGTWSLDLDLDNAVQGSGTHDFRLTNQTSTDRWFDPTAPARFYTVP